MNHHPFVPSGAIFDLDDTLLDNSYSPKKDGYHERLRLQAMHEIGKARGIDSLRSATIEQSIEAFRTVKTTTFTHTLWNMLCMLNIRHNPDEPEPNDELMVAITTRKNDLYKNLLVSDVREVVGSTNFVRKMATLTNDNVAIGSSARLDDIKLYLDTKGIIEFFPDRKIISLESVTHAKPNPEVFNKAFDSLGLPESKRATTCVFEDDPRGVMAAKAAGLYACAITTRHTTEEFLSSFSPPDLIASSYDEFSEHFFASTS